MTTTGGAMNQENAAEYPDSKSRTEHGNTESAMWSQKSSGVEFSVEQSDRDFEMLESLINERKKQFPVLSDFSASLGIPKEIVEEFESDPDSFSVGFVRLYAIGLRAAIHHHVETSTALKEKL